jgi:hypothetical protein
LFRRFVYSSIYSSILMLVYCLHRNLITNSTIWVLKTWNFSIIEVNRIFLQRIPVFLLQIITFMSLIFTLLMLRLDFVEHLDISRCFADFSTIIWSMAKGKGSRCHTFRSELLYALSNIKVFFWSNELNKWKCSSFKLASILKINTEETDNEDVTIPWPQVCLSISLDQYLTRIH